MIIRTLIQGKVFLLKDCLPDVPSNLDLLFSKSKNILIKTSPILDIKNGINELRYVKEVHVVAVDNEVKELLWILETDYQKDIFIKTVDIKKNRTQEFSFALKDESNALVEFSLPKKYLYEPNAAILKSGGFLSIGCSFEVQKLHINSHLYTSDRQLDFPGRKFEVILVIPYQKKAWSRLRITKANITVRNFPDSVVSIRKKLRIKDGGEHYLFFTTDMNNQKIMIVCKKI